MTQAVVNASPLIYLGRANRLDLLLLAGDAHPPATAVIDDRLARRCAAAFSIPARGTLGLVLLAKTRGVIPAARPVVEELKRLGMYLSDIVIAEALSMVDE